MKFSEFPVNGFFLFISGKRVIVGIKIPPVTVLRSSVVEVVCNAYAYSGSVFEDNQELVRMEDGWEVERLFDLVPAHCFLKS